jgi:hypothetical protein
VPIFQQIKVHRSNHFKLDFIITFKNKTNSLNVFEVHHRTKPKSIRLIVASVTYLDFQFQKSIAPIILYILHTNQFHYINTEVYNFKMSPIYQFHNVQNNIIITTTFKW